MAHQANVSWRGWRVCSCIITVVEEMMEPRLIEAGIIKNSLDIYQASYNAGGVSASAGTHDQGGALDTMKLNDAGTKIMRECGTTSWQRGSPEDTAFDDHNHAIWIGCSDLSSGAADQVNDYKNGRNGLADNGPDKSPDVPYTTWQDALAKYQQEAGMFGMSTMKSYSNGKEQKFTGDGDWHTMRIDDDGSMSFLSGPKDAYIAVTCFTLEKLPDKTGTDGVVTPDPKSVQAGDVVQVRYANVSDFSDDRPTVTDYWYPIQELTITGGGTFGQIVWLNSMGGPKVSGATAKLRVFINPPSGKTVRVTKVSGRALY